MITDRGRHDRRVGSDASLVFRTDGGAFLMAEAAYKSSLDIGTGSLPSSYKLGAWFHGNDFADQHLDSSGRSLAAPALPLFALPVCSQVAPNASSWLTFPAAISTYIGMSRTTMCL